MKKHLFLLLNGILLMFSFASYTQGTDFIKMSIPVVDSTLQISSLRVDLHSNGATYLRNDDYVVYQENYVRKVLKPDMNSFEVPRNRYYISLFAKDKNGIYYRGNFIKTDTTNFRTIGDTYDYDVESERGERQRVIIWKSGNKVFRDTVDVTGDIDVPTFESVSRALSGSYFKDKNFVYYYEKKIDGSDPSTVVDGIWTPYDKNYVYEKDKIKMYEGDTVRSVNRVLMKTSKTVLMRDQNSREPKVQPDIDPKTIKPLSRFFSMDKNNVYHKTEKTPVKKKRLKKVKVWDQMNSAYVSDGKNLYSYLSGRFNKNGTDNLDAKSFGMFPNSDLFFDKNGVYTKRGEKLPFVYTKNVSDKNTFMTKLLDGSRYIVYENQIHYNEIYPDSDKKFKKLTKEQIKLARENNLHYNDILLEKDPRKRIEGSLYEYEGKIYYKDSVIAIADAQTLEKIEPYYYKDKNYIYEYYWSSGLTPLEGVDVETFGSTKISPFYKDKDYIYTRRYRVIKNQELEILGMFMGYRSGSNSIPRSDYYLFKNIDGYWIVLVSNGVTVRNLGFELDDKLKALLSE